MASTIAPAYAFDAARRWIKNPPDADIRVDIANNIYQRMWNAGNFVWTLGSVSVVLTPSSPNTPQQDYVFTSPTSLTDCARFVRGYISSPTTGSVGIRTDGVTEVTPVSFIPANSTMAGLARSFYWIPGSPDKIRLDVAAAYPSSTVFYGIYKKNMTPFTELTLTNTTNFAIPDEFYYVFQEGVLWKYYQYVGDQRAGDVKMQGDNVSYSGQLAVFMDGITDMKSRLPEMFLDMKMLQELKD